MSMGRAKEGKKQLTDSPGDALNDSDAVPDEDETLQPARHAVISSTKA